MTKGSESALHIFQADLSRVPDLADLKHRVDADILPVSDHVDVFISSVGFTTAMKPALETTPQEFRDHFEVNTIGPLIVFQAFWPLMVKPNADDESEKSSRQPSAPKLIFLSSSVGCIGEWMEPITGGAYGPSKAALNWLARKLHFELEKDKIVSVALHPGSANKHLPDFLPIAMEANVMQLELTVSQMGSDRNGRPRREVMGLSRQAADNGGPECSRDPSSCEWLQISGYSWRR